MNWAKLLPGAEFAYNNSRNSSTKMTPFRALYSYDPELQVDISPKDSATKGEAPVAYDRISRLAELRQQL